MDQLLISLVLAIVVFLQIIQIAQYRARLREVEKVALNPATKTQANFALLANFPHPLVVVNGSGNALFSTPAFQEMMASLGFPVPANLQELDRYLESDIEKHVTREIGLVQLSCTLTARKTDEPMRRYVVLAWPVSSSLIAQGHIITFYEQTLSTHRQREYSNLEQQLLQYLGHMAGQLDGLTQRIEKISPQTKTERLHLISEVANQMEGISQYLTTHHRQLRTLTPQTSVDVKAIIEKVTKELRPHLRSHTANLTLNLPGQLTALTNKADFQLALTTLLTALIDRIQTHDTVHISATQQENEVLIGIELPQTDLHPKHGLSESNLANLHEDGLQQFKLRFTLARQFIAKYHGTLRIGTNPGLGTTCSISLMAAKKSAK